jgi:vancomycin permeability regulator SanA
VGSPSAKPNAYREHLARARLWLDVKILKTDPKFLGGEEELLV